MFSREVKLGASPWLWHTSSAVNLCHLREKDKIQIVAGAAETLFIYLFNFALCSATRRKEEKSKRRTSEYYLYVSPPILCVLLWKIPPSHLQSEPTEHTTGVWPLWSKKPFLFWNFSLKGLCQWNIKPPEKKKDQPNVLPL